MSIHDLIEKIEAEVMTYNHVRDTETHMVADLVVWVKNTLDDMKAAKEIKIPMGMTPAMTKTISK